MYAIARLAQSAKRKALDLVVVGSGPTEGECICSYSWRVTRLHSKEARIKSHIDGSDAFDALSSVGLLLSAGSCNPNSKEMRGRTRKRAHPDLNQGPADLQSAAPTAELCTQMTSRYHKRLGVVLRGTLAVAQQRTTQKRSEGSTSQLSMVRWLTPGGFLKATCNDNQRLHRLAEVPGSAPP